MASSSSGDAGASNDVQHDPIIAAIRAIQAITAKKGAFTKADAEQISVNVTKIEVAYLPQLIEIKTLKGIRDYSTTIIDQLTKLTTEKVNNNNNNRTYASIAAGVASSPDTPTPTPTASPPVDPDHTVRALLKDPKTTSSEATKQFLRTIDLKDCKANVLSMKSIRNGWVSILTRSDAEASALYRHIANLEIKNLELQLPEKRLPTFSMLLPGLDHDVDAVVKTLNKRYFWDDEEDITLVHKFRTKNNNTVIIIEVSPEARFRIIHHNYKVAVGWSIVTLRERTNVTRCHNCQRYGHKSPACKNTLDGEISPRCVRCGENHKMDQCTSAPKCINCSDHNKFAAKRGARIYPIEHAADDETCTMYIKAVERAKALVHHHVSDEFRRKEQAEFL